MLLVSEHVSGTHLAPMKIAELQLPAAEDEGNPSKRQQVGDSGESDVSLGVAVATRSASSKKNKNEKSKRGRSNPKGNVEPIQGDHAIIVIF